MSLKEVKGYLRGKGNITQSGRMMTSDGYLHVKKEPVREIKLEGKKEVDNPQGSVKKE